MNVPRPWSSPPSSFSTEPASETVTVTGAPGSANGATGSASFSAFSAFSASSSAEPGENSGAGSNSAVPPSSAVASGADAGGVNAVYQVVANSEALGRGQVSALRSTLAALDNATAVPSSGSLGSGSEHVAGGAVGVGAAEAPRRELTEADALAVVRAEIAERRTAADAYGPGPAADRLRAEADQLTAPLLPRSDA